MAKHHLHFLMNHFAFRHWRPLPLLFSFCSKFLYLRNLKCYQLKICTYCKNSIKIPFQFQKIFDWPVSLRFLMYLFSTIGETNVLLQHLTWNMKFKEKHVRYSIMFKTSISKSFYECNIFIYNLLFNSFEWNKPVSTTLKTTKETYNTCNYNPECSGRLNSLPLL